MPPLPQPILLDLLTLAVGKTALKEQLGTEEFRAQIVEHMDELVAGDKLRLQAVWNLFAPRTGFDPKVAACPMCWLKQLEGRLGVVVELPAELATLKSSDIATNAAKVFVRREDVDKLLGPDTGVRVRATTPLPASYVRAAVAAPPPSAQFSAVEPGAPPSAEPGALAASLFEPGAPPAAMAEPGAPPSLTSQVATVATSSRALPPVPPVSPRQKLYAMLAGGGFLLSAAVMAVSLRSSCAKDPTSIELRVASLPVKAGTQFGKDARFVLTDPAWLTSGSKDERVSALQDALHGLRVSGIENLSIVDANGKLRASAQSIGTEARVKFY